MIEVPQVVIAGLRVGPVWFTQRPDRAFREWMSSMTDRPIEGALGGSAFKTTRMILDYPGGRAYFSPAPRERSAAPAAAAVRSPQLGRGAAFARTQGVTGAGRGWRRRANAWRSEAPLCRTRVALAAHGAHRAGFPARAVPRASCDAEVTRCALPSEPACA